MYPDPRFLCGQIVVKYGQNCPSLRSFVLLIQLFEFVGSAACLLYLELILNMNIWSAQQNDNSNERTFNHTNLIISYRFGFFFKFNCEIDDFWFSTNQRSACLAKMPHWRVLRDHKSDLIRVIMFYYTAIFIIRIFLKVWLILYDAKHEIFIGWEICVFSGTNTFDRFTDRKPRRGVRFRSVAFLLPRLPRCAVPRIEFWKFSGFNTFFVWLVSQWKPFFVVTN